MPAHLLSPLTDTTDDCYLVSQTVESIWEKLKSCSLRSLLIMWGNLFSYTFSRVSNFIGLLKLNFIGLLKFFTDCEKNKAHLSAAEVIRMPDYGQNKVPNTTPCSKDGAAVKRLLVVIIPESQPFTSSNWKRTVGYFFPFIFFLKESPSF